MRGATLERHPPREHPDRDPVEALDIFLRAIKAPVKWARRVLTRALHPRRRRTAETLLRDGPPVRSVLFVCLGNVCRSPYAEFAMRSATGDLGASITVASAGFIGPGRSSPEEAIREAAGRGLDLTPHVSKTVTREMVAASDLVVVMEPKQAGSIAPLLDGRSTRVIVLGDLDPLPAERRTIPDPWGKGPEQFRDSFDRVDRCLAELLRLGVGAP